MGINLKKYNLNNLADYDLEYIKVDDTENFKYYLDVMLNNKKIGSIHVDHKRDSTKNVSFNASELSPIHSTNYYQNVEAIKKYIVHQIETIITFISKHYGSDWFKKYNLSNLDNYHIVYDKIEYEETLISSIKVSVNNYHIGDIDYDYRDRVMSFQTKIKLINNFKANKLSDVKKNIQHDLNIIIAVTKALFTNGAPSSLPKVLDYFGDDEFNEPN